MSLNDLNGKRIVLAEDEGITVMQLGRALTRAGLVVVASVNNGCDAVEAAIRERPDIVLLDIGMPILDGLEAARRIMAEAPTCIVMLSGNADVEIAEQAGAYGVAGYITKPITSEHLVPALHQALQMFYECTP